MKLLTVFYVITTLVIGIAQAQGQQQTPQPQIDTWNSNYSISALQAQNGGIDSTMAQAISLGINFERTNWATGSVQTDSFYAPPSNASNATVGTLLRVQESANTTKYTLPPEVALSRILYMTEDLNGTAIPASAFILWPYLPASQPDGSFPAIAWAHGTSGIFGECGPSHWRDLFYQYTAVYELALQGYVVIAPDYAGMGVNHTADGKPIYHPYLANPSAANDLFYAVQAAQTAFPKISKEFVVMGHSQGGAAAWSAAIRQAQRPVNGYLGTVAASPPTNLSTLSAMTPAQAPPVNQFFIASAIRSLHPDFNLSAILTTDGVKRLQLAEDIGACNSALLSLLPPNSTTSLVQPDWLQVPEVQAWMKYDDLGGQQLAGPMLVLQGTADMNVPELFTTGSVAATCAKNPQSGIDYRRFTGVAHFPTLYASQRIYLSWIADRFAHRNTSTFCTQTNYTAMARPVAEYQSEIGYFLEYANAPYQSAI